MNQIGGIIKERRLAHGWSKRALAEKAGISHSEVHRIEIGDRENPSVPVLNSLADALGIPKNDMLMWVGYRQDDGDVPMLERAFPDLKTSRKKEAAQQIIDSLSRDDIADEDVDVIMQQVEIALTYAKNKKNPK